MSTSCYNPIHPPCLLSGLRSRRGWLPYPVHVTRKCTMLSFQSAKLVSNHHGLPHPDHDPMVNLHRYGNHTINLSLNPSPTPSPKGQSPATRRRSLLLSTALSVSAPLPPPPSFAAEPSSVLDTTITDRVFLDFSMCPTFFRVQPQDPLGQLDLPPCSDSEPMGRVVLGLYGKLVPITVSIFKAMCTGTAGSSYKNTLVHKLLPGQFLVAGRQGRREKGEVMPPSASGLPRNTETVDSRAFMLQHSRPGLISLCLAENDDDDDIKLNPNYHNVEFLITTGPAPCPQLDGTNIIFGTVLQGLDVVRAIASTPTYKPAERVRQLNDLAEFLGDERAQNARNLWNRPLKAIYISDCGELQVAKPSLSPSLP